MTNFIVTGSGLEIDFDNLAGSVISIEDMVYALDRIPRFNGHLNTPYSVLDHSLNCLHYAVCQKWPDGAQLACLIHDLHEGVIGDISTPIKSVVPELRRLEKRVEEAAHGQWGVTTLMQTYANQVKQADLALLIAERDVFLPGVKRRWGADALVTVPYGMTPEIGMGIGDFVDALDSLEPAVLPFPFIEFLETL